MPSLRKALAGTGILWLGLRAFAAVRPTAFPYFARAILDAPRPLITRRALVEILEPRAGERMLEIGPGTGYYTLAVAERLAPDGIVEILDVRERFLDHTLNSARRRGIENLSARLARDEVVPYPDAIFDAAFLVSVLGELPNPRAGLRELRRVIKPTGRVVVGEIFIDPDFLRLASLVREAEAAGLRFDGRSGSPLAYFARFRPA